MTTHQQVTVKGMHCASCASIIEKTLTREPGVEKVEVNVGTETAHLSFDDQQTSISQLSEKLQPLGYALSGGAEHHMNMSADEHAQHTGLGQSKAEKLQELAALRYKVWSAMPLAVLAIFSMGWDIAAELGWVPMPSHGLKGAVHLLLPMIATYTLFVVGNPYLMGLYRFLRYGKANMDTLIGLGTSVAFLYSIIIALFAQQLRPYIDVTAGYYDVVIVVIAFITLGKYLEAASKLKTGDAIEKLLTLQAKTALIRKDKQEKEVPIAKVMVGDIVVIKSAARIPVDGIVIEGSSYVDEAMMSGEPIPVEKNIGDAVIGGTVNTSGTFVYKATKVGADTVLAHIIKMVQDAQGSKAPIQALADKISAVFVPIVLVLAVLALDAWLIIGTPILGFAQAVSYGLVSFVSILVIACPCALGLATPTAIIVGVGKGAKEGILIKDAATLETLHKASVLVLDKTGTLTQGKPEVVSIHAQEGKEAELIAVLATLESRSEHPIAHAIATYASAQQIALRSLEQFEALKGKGVSGMITGRTYMAGSEGFMKELGLKISAPLLRKETKKGRTPIFLATQGELLATVFIADAVKPQAKQAIEQLHRNRLHIVMVTGDNKQTAEYVGEQLGIDEIYAGVLPQEKLEIIKKFQQERGIVAMAGDGVNDAPALAQADVGIAMSTGTDVAIDSAGITLLHGDISKLVKAIRLSRLTMNGIRQNLFWAFVYNIIGIPLAAGIFFPILGWMLSPIFAGAAMAFSSVSVVTNSLRLKLKKL